MARLLSRIGGFSARHRWAVVTAWLALLLIAVGGAARWSRPLDTGFDIAGLQSVTTLNRVTAEFGAAAGAGTGNVVFAAPPGSRLTSADAATVATLSRNLAAVPGVESAPDPFTADVKTLSPDGRIGYIPVTLGADQASAVTLDGIARAVEAARGPRLQVETSSELTSTTDSPSNPAAGLLLALVVLLITFGSFVAAGLPLLTALLGLGASIAAIHAVTALVPVNSVGPTLATLLALAVGIDYCLFIASRHRRHLLEGMDVRDSIPLTMGTAGSAVTFAALTVVIGLSGLAVVRIGFLTQMGLSAAFAVVVAMLVSLTLTPALLRIAGPRLLGRRARRRMAGGTPGASRRPARRWARMVASHPVVFGLASLALLGLLAAPAFDMHLGLPNDGTQPSTATQRRAYDLMAEGFTPGVNAPILVLATFPSAPSRPAITALTSDLAAVPGVRRVVPTGTRGADVLLTVVPKTGPSDTATGTLVHTLRQPSAIAGVEPAPTVQVSGHTAVAIDVSQRLLDALPLYLVLVAGFTFLLLVVVFRSLLIPLKATVCFLLSLGASLGATVAVFQWGWLGRLFGVDPAGPLMSFLPILVIGVLFGLSMDYEMFLVSGMRERHAHGAGARDAVTSGFAQGAKVVAAAALIMIGVFGNGVFTGDSLIRPIAFGLAIGVLVDAFVVRMVLVPAVMTLLGASAWWLPGPLDRLVPDVDIEGSTLVRPHPAAPTVPVPSPAAGPLVAHSAAGTDR